MISFLLRRILSSIPVVLTVLALCFLLVRIAPGSPFATERALDPKTKAYLEEKYGLSGSLPQQVIRYGSNVLHGDLGDSLKFRGRTVVEIIAQSLPRSLLLGSIAFTLALGLGIPMGAWAAARHNKAPDHWLNSIALLTLSIPTFVLAPVAVLFSPLEFHFFHPRDGAPYPNLFFRPSAWLFPLWGFVLGLHAPD